MIARGLVGFYEGSSVNVWQFTGWLLGLNAFGFGVSLLAKKLQGIGSQYARDSLKQSFFQALVARDGQFDSRTTAANIFNIAS